MIDAKTDFGARVARRLREDVVVWLTTVGARGAPLPTPVWFSWDGDASVRIYSLPTAARVRHVAANPRVSLNFDGNRRGGDIVVLAGRATANASAPGADAHEPYTAKYREQMAGIGRSPERFAAEYSVALDVRLERLRGH